VMPRDLSVGMFYHYPASQSKSASSTHGYITCLGFWSYKPALWYSTDYHI